MVIEIEIVLIKICYDAALILRAYFVKERCVFRKFISWLTNMLKFSFRRENTIASNALTFWHSAIYEGSLLLSGIILITYTI